MSGATAALRIVSREAVVFEEEEDGAGDIVSRKARNSWSPKMIARGYETIKPDFSSPMEVKSTRSEAATPSSTDYRVIAFGAGILIFAIGMVLLFACLLMKNDNMKLGASAFLAVGSVTAALALLRGQSDDERG